MRKFAILLCFVLLLLIIGGQIVDYINYERELNTVYSPQSLGPEKAYTSITISAVGDCTLGTDINFAGGGSFENEMKSVSYDYSHFLSNVKDIFEDDDLTIVNFEGTLSDRGVRQEKEYAFRGKPDYINILTSSSVEATNLANNHTRDYGEAAFSDTKDIMTTNNIIWFEGSNIAITEIKGIKIGLIGVNTQRHSDKANFLNNLDKLKESEPDIIIASFHWGVEKAATPNDSQISLAHSAIDNGVDLVIGHHPHVLQGIEKYNGKYIVYSLGNFCYGGSRNPADMDTMIFRQTFLFDKGKPVPEENVSIIPCSISSSDKRNNFQPTPLSGKEFDRVKEKLFERSSDFPGIEDINFIEIEKGM